MVVMQAIDSPFGSWPMDVDMLSFETHELNALLLGVDRQVLSFERDSDAYVVKLWYDALEEAYVPRQLRICQLAGDCVVPIVGRAYRHGDWRRVDIDIVGRNGRSGGRELLWVEEVVIGAGVDVGDVAVDVVDDGLEGIGETVLLVD